MRYGRYEGLGDGIELAKAGPGGLRSWFEALYLRVQVVWGALEARSLGISGDDINPRRHSSFRHPSRYRGGGYELRPPSRLTPE